MAIRPSIPFFTDENVADSVGDALASAGHKLVRARDAMGRSTVDDILGLACLHSGHVLISHDNDFKGVAKRLALTQQQHQKRLHRIDLRCEEPAAANRVRALMSLIEHEWQMAAATNGQMVIAIRDTTVWINR